MCKQYGRLCGVMAAVALTFGMVSNSSATSCEVNDVTLGGDSANYCGWGSTNNDTVPGGSANWQVNLDGIEGGGWTLFEKENDPEHEGNTAAIGLSTSGIGGTSGEFSLTAHDPILIVCKPKSEPVPLVTHPPGRFQSHEFIPLHAHLSGQALANHGSGH